MTSTVRSRLWLSYVIVIIFILAVIVVGILFSLLRNPVIRQGSNIRLLSISQTTVIRIERVLRTNPARLDETLSLEANARNIRLLLLNSSGQPIIDSGEGDQPPIILDVLTERYWDGASFSVTDASNGEWTGVIRPLSTGDFVMVLLDQPRYPLVNLFRDDVLAPILLAGTIALVLALLITLGFSQWITRPLRGMAAAARSSRGDSAVRMQIAGPREVQEVASAFNDLMLRVASSQQSQQDFLSNISHELKTPLTSIQGFAQAIRDGTLNENLAISDAGRVIYDEANRMNRLVLQLMALSRLESGATQIQLQSTDIAEIIRNLVSRHRMQANEKCIEIDLHLDSPPLIEADGDQMSQVFGNLIENAIKYTLTGGHISIILEVDVATVTVRVQDNGPGIAAKDLDRIFERFYQVDVSRRGDQDRGVGLGLAIARQIVLSHRGAIWAESQPGQGSCFIVRLPIHQKDVITKEVKGHA